MYMKCQVAERSTYPFILSHCCRRERLERPTGSAYAREHQKAPCLGSWGRDCPMEVEAALRVTTARLHWSRAWKMHGKRGGNAGLASANGEQNVDWWGCKFHVTHLSYHLELVTEAVDDLCDDHQDRRGSGHRPMLYDAVGARMTLNSRKILYSGRPEMQATLCLQLLYPLCCERHDATALLL